jgi:hypothetical protein
VKSVRSSSAGAAGAALAIHCWATASGTSIWPRTVFTMIPVAGGFAGSGDVRFAAARARALRSCRGVLFLPMLNLVSSPSYAPIFS